MGIGRSLYRDLTGEQYRTAVTVGAAAVPLLVIENALYGPADHTEPVSGLALFAACLVSGSIYSARAGEASRAGAVTGITGGSVLVLWQGWLTVTEWWNNEMLVDLVGDSWGMSAAVVAGTLATLAIGLAVTAVLGILAGTIGGRLYRIGRNYIGSPET